MKKQFYTLITLVLCMLTTLGVAQNDLSLVYKNAKDEYVVELLFQESLIAQKPIIFHESGLGKIVIVEDDTVITVYKYYSNDRAFQTRPVSMGAIYVPKYNVHFAFVTNKSFNFGLCERKEYKPQDGLWDEIISTTFSK